MFFEKKVVTLYNLIDRIVFLKYTFKNYIK